MKFAILFLLGLLLGAMGATIVVNTLGQRDAYPRGLMNVMGHHYASLREALRTQRCDNMSGTQLKSTLAIAQMRALTEDIEPAMYPGERADPPFREFNDRLRNALAEVPAPAPADCAALQPLVQKIGKACDDCHQQYR
jgi:cytochrome c556